MGAALPGGESAGLSVSCELCVSAVTQQHVCTVQNTCHPYSSASTGMVQIEELVARNSELREERQIFAKQAEDVKAKYKGRQQQWKDERMRMVRCLDAQTKTNTAHLQEISRQLAPGGSLRQSLDLSLGCSSDMGLPHTPRSSASMRRHSLAVPGIPRMHSCSHGGTSMCSSPHMSATSTHLQAVHFEVRLHELP